MSEITHQPAPEHTAHEHHVTPPIVYMVIFGCLLVFTALTVGASYIEMGVFNPIVALAIGVVKATLVVLFFMGVKYSSRLTWLTVFAGLFTFLALIGMTLSDYFSRAWGRW
ncbi:MAG: cytochrome C oxidase subunit IV family protein [Terracidiphilus sp.]|jgi:cytochrome c oxidase subunit 4